MHLQQHSQTSFLTHTSYLYPTWRLPFCVPVLVAFARPAPPAAAAAVSTYAEAWMAVWTPGSFTRVSLCLLQKHSRRELELVAVPSRRRVLLPLRLRGLAGAAWAAATAALHGAAALMMVLNGTCAARLAEGGRCTLPSLQHTMNINPIQFKCWVQPAMMICSGWGSSTSQYRAMCRYSRAEWEAAAMCNKPTSIHAITAFLLASTSSTGG